MPVCGVRDKSPKGLKFRKFSFRFVLCILYSLGLLWMLAIEIIWLYRSSLEFGKIVNVIFDASNMISILCFLELARKWPDLMMKWYEVEKFLPQLKYQMDKQKMAYEIKMVSFMILFISMGRIKFLCCFWWLQFSLFQLNIFYPSRSVHMAPTTVHRFAIQFVLIMFQIIRKSFSSILIVELWVVSQNFSTSSLPSLGVSQARRWRRGY